MPSHVYHHIVPRFYLKGWTINHKLTRFQWVRGELEMREVGTKRIAGLNNLYALHHAPKDPQIVEREFMGRLIDDPAAQAYNHMVKTPAPISEIQRASWTRFLMSLRVRSPDVIERLRVEAEGDLRRRLVAQPEEYDALRGSDEPRNLYEYIEQRRPGFVADFGIRILPDIVNHPPIAQKIYQMYWWTQRFEGATVDLLTSDRPLIIVPGLHDPTCVMALPLTPQLAFFATHSLEQAKRVCKQPASRLARALNHETARLADKQIYAVNARQMKFVRRWFKPQNEPTAE